MSLHLLMRLIFVWSIDQRHVLLDAQTQDQVLHPALAHLALLAEVGHARTLRLELQLLQLLPGVQEEHEIGPRHPRRGGAGPRREEDERHAPTRPTTKTP